MLAKVFVALVACIASLAGAATTVVDLPTPVGTLRFLDFRPDAPTATILVLPNRRHTRAGPDGSFTLEGVPPGTWTVFAYTRRALKPASAKVTVTSGGATSVDLALVRGAEVEHRNKYGTKYTGGGGPYQ